MKAAGLAARFALVVFGIAVGVLAVEVALRLAGPPQELASFRGLHELRPDRPWLYHLRPGAAGRAPGGYGYGKHYRINGDGFRDRVYARPKPPGVFRVAVLGDSLAFGYGVAEEDAFPKVLERRLAEIAPERPIEVLNMGVGGYNPYLEAEFLKDVALDYEPDLVLVQFCINDLNEPTLHFDFHARQRLGAIPDAAFPDPARRREPSHGVWLIEALCMRLESCSRLYDRIVAWTNPELGPRARVEGLTPIERTAGPEWQWLAERYGEMARVSRRAGARFAVVAVPHRRQLERGAPDPVQQRLVELGERGGWTTVDPLPAFRQAWSRQQKVFLDWWHPTRRGHRLTAEAILEQLACGDLLPPEARRPCDDGVARGTAS